MSILKISTAKKLFFTYFALVLGFLYVYYNQYQNTQNQKRFMEYTNKLYDFDISKKYLSSKLDNMFFQYFNDFVLKKTIQNINESNADLKELLNTLLYNKYYSNTDLLKDVVIYDPRGKKIFNFNKNLSHNDINLDALKEVEFQEDLFFESLSNGGKNLIKINDLFFQGEKIGYIKQTVDFDIFMVNFLPKYEYTFLKSKMENIQEGYDLELYDLQGIKHIFDIQKNDVLKKDPFENSYFIPFLFALFLGVVFYFIYKGLKKQEDLKRCLKSQKEFFRSIINTSPNAIFVKDSNKRYLTANAATAKLFSIEDANLLLNKSNEQLQINDKAVKSLNFEEESTLKFKIARFKQVQKINDKYYKFVHVPLYGLSYPTKEDMVIGFATDITTAIESKNELAKLNTQLKIDILEEMTSKIKINEKFKKIFDNISDGMFVCDINENRQLQSFIEINSAGNIFLKRFGYIHTPPKDIFAKLKFEYNEKLNMYEIKKYGYVLKIGKENNEINFKVTCNLLMLNNNYYAVIFIQNIDEIIKLKKEHIKQNKILSQQSKMAEMGEMIGAIAHQWRQPLNAINAAAIKLNFSSSLNMLDKKEVIEKSKFIEEQSLKMSETINDFMYFFKPSKKKDNFSLTQVYKKIFDFLQPQLKNRDINIIFNLKKDITLYGFKNEFEHILLNLINNAKDAFLNIEKDCEKYIKINAYERKEEVILTVADNAGGIPKEILNKIFNPYFTTKEEGKGTGIGLYMTKTIIDKHFNGSIKVDNEEDGAVFTINLPKRSEKSC